MDDYTWQRLLLKRKRRQKRNLFLLFLFMASILGGSIWYSFIYVRTPEYAITQVQKAIETQDVETFRHYVNVELVSSRAYDDLTVDLFAYDSTLTPNTRIMFEKFYLMIKPQLAGGMEDAVLNRLSTGAWNLPEGTNILKGRQLGIDFERFIERSQIRNTTIKSVGAITHDGTEATAEIQLLEDYTQTSFTLELALTQAEDGHWQIAYIKNYKAYLDAISPLMNQDLADYIDATKDIVEAYNGEFSGYQSRFKALNVTSTGRQSASQRKQIAQFLEDEVIPALKKRQSRLDAIEIPAGAQYLARQRQQSTETTIKAWQHYIKGLRENKQSEFSTAETLHKQELAIDLRIDDIIKHTAISKNIPNLP